MGRRSGSRLFADLPSPPASFPLGLADTAGSLQYLTPGPLRQWVLLDVWAQAGAVWSHEYYSHLSPHTSHLSPLTSPHTSHLTPSLWVCVCVYLPKDYDWKKNLKKQIPIKEVKYWGIWVRWEERDVTDIHSPLWETAPWEQQATQDQQIDCKI